MGFGTTQGRPATHVSATGHVAFRTGDSVGALIASFRSSIPSPSVPLFTLHWEPRGNQCKTRGRVDRYSFLVRLLHPRLPAGLIPAHHHIFFPPRLEVVVEQQNPDCFPSHSWNQSPPHGFLGHQSHGPPGPAFGRVAAHHGNDALPLAVLQQCGRSGSLLLVDGSFEPPLLVAMADLPNGLRS